MLHSKPTHQYTSNTKINLQDIDWFDEKNMSVKISPLVYQCYEGRLIDLIPLGAEYPMKMLLVDYLAIHSQH